MFVIYYNLCVYHFRTLYLILIDSKTTGTLCEMEMLITAHSKFSANTLQKRLGQEHVSPVLQHPFL